MATPSPLQSADTAPTRRTQEQRSAEMRNRLLDATVESLIDRGYARTTTTVVCDRAGVSRGAQVHHFGTKAELVIAAVTHLARKQEVELRRQADSVLCAEDRTARLVDAIVEIYASPLFYAALELWVAARTDADLLASLLEFERVVGKKLGEVWQEFGGDTAEAPDFDSIIELTMHLARGMALQKILRSDDRSRHKLLEMWKAMAKQALRADITH
ncbi:MAG: TetR/AcrR family transcriptional regulator [Myxococcota bacterium]|nr:TetR/AcrR family transcriptional regulator [Myxococcota bacterium]